MLKLIQKADGHSPVALNDALVTWHKDKVHFKICFCFFGLFFLTVTRYFKLKKFKINVFK